MDFNTRNSFTKKLHTSESQLIQTQEGTQTRQPATNHQQEDLRASQASSSPGGALGVQGLPPSVDHNGLSPPPPQSSP